MDVIHFPDDQRPSRWAHPVLALGNFDGVHRGHQKILERLRRVALEHGATSVVMTFDPHPPRVVRPDKAPLLLMTKEQKLDAIAAAGIQGSAVLRFTPEVSRWDPEMFVTTILVDWLQVSEVWVGANFLFGHDRAGNFSLLRTLGARYGFKAEKIDPIRYKDFVVSSTRVRRLVAEGRVDEAGALLGHQYYVDGTVVRGDGRGKTIRGFPHREPLYRQRASAAFRRLCHDDDHGGWRGEAVGNQRGCSAHGGFLGQSGGRDAHFQFRQGSLWRGHPASGSCSSAARRADV